MRPRLTIGLLVVCGALLANSSRVGTASAQIKMIEAALETFRMDHGRYPTTEEGLAALIERPSALHSGRPYPKGGYLRDGRVPDDPWGYPYQYRCPPERNSESFDLWTLGADGTPGGSGLDADAGNWPDGFAEHEALARREAFVFALQTGVVAGGVLGAPIYVFGLLSAARGRRRWRSALLGPTFAVLIYLVLACTLGSVLFFHALDY